MEKIFQLNKSWYSAPILKSENNISDNVVLQGPPIKYKGLFQQINDNNQFVSCKDYTYYR